MASDMEIQLLQRLDKVSDQVGEVAVTVGKMDGVAELLRDHEARVKRLEKWQARLIGGYTAAGVLAGVGFQLVMNALK